MTAPPIPGGYRPPITEDLEKRIIQLNKAHHAVLNETRTLLGRLHQQGAIFPDLLTHLLGDAASITYRIELLLKSEYLLDASNPPGRYNYCQHREQRSGESEAPTENGRSKTTE